MSIFRTSSWSGMKPSMGSRGKISFLTSSSETCFSLRSKDSLDLRPNWIGTTRYTRGNPSLRLSERWITFESRVITTLTTNSGLRIVKTNDEGEEMLPLVLLLVGEVAGEGRDAETYVARLVAVAGARTPGEPRGVDLTEAGDVSAPEAGDLRVVAILGGHVPLGAVVAARIVETPKGVMGVAHLDVLLTAAKNFGNLASVTSWRNSVIVNIGMRVLLVRVEGEPVLPDRTKIRTGSLRRNLLLVVVSTYPVGSGP